MQPTSQKNLFLVAYPNPIIHSNGNEASSLQFVSRPEKRANERSRDPIQAILPLTSEDANTCSILLLGRTPSIDRVHFQFLAEYKKKAAMTDGYLLDAESVKAVIRENPDSFTLTPSPIAQGAVRFLKSTTAISYQGDGARLALQPQLMAVEDYFKKDARLSNGVSLAELEDHRRSLVPVQTSPFGVKRALKIPAAEIGDRLPGISPLSEAIALQKRFDNNLVLREIAVLLGGNKDDIAAYLEWWQKAAVSSLSLRFSMFRGAEDYAYGNNSWMQCREK
jgi:hypothetical protein